MATLGARRLVADRAAAVPRPGARRAADLDELPHEDVFDEPYRPELVARLERAVREGRYRPDARAIADAVVTRIDTLLGR